MSTAGGLCAWSAVKRDTYARMYSSGKWDFDNEEGRKEGRKEFGVVCHVRRVVRSSFVLPPSPVRRSLDG